MLTKKKAGKTESPKQKYVTPQQFLRMRLSKAIVQVMEDITRLRASGMRIDMRLWWSVRPEGNRPCSVCLGGAALCSFAPAAVNGYGVLTYGEKVLGITEDQVGVIAKTFDYLRTDDIVGALMTWHEIPQRKAERITKKITKGVASSGFYGELNDRDFNNLINYLSSVVKELRKQGY